MSRTHFENVSKMFSFVLNTDVAIGRNMSGQIRPNHDGRKKKNKKRKCMKIDGVTHETDNNYYIDNFNAGNCLSGLYCNIPLTFGDGFQCLSGWRIEESFAVIHH